MRDIDSRCPKCYKPSAKEDKDKNNNQDTNKAISYNLSPANISQPQTQTFRKDKRHRNCWGNPFATGVNAIKVIKKEKNKVKDLSYIEYYTHKQKGHYINKYFEKLKNLL